MSLPAEKLAILAAEIVGDSLARGYAQMSDSEVADDLARIYRAGRQAVYARDVRRYVLLNGIWPAVQALAADVNAALQSRGAAITFLETLAPNSFDQFNLQETAVYQGVDASLGMLQAAGVLTADQRADLLGLADTQMSRAHELGLDGLDHIDVARARGVG